VSTVRLALQVPYERIGAVKRLVHPPQVELEREEYGERATLVLAVHEDRREALEAALADLGVALSVASSKA
jgi:putative IMPACT (imprinted ancient) family translation regulator